MADKLLADTQDSVLSTLPSDSQASIASSLPSESEMTQPASDTLLCMEGRGDKELSSMVPVSWFNDFGYSLDDVVAHQMNEGDEPQFKCVNGEMSILVTKVFWDKMKEAARNRCASTSPATDVYQTGGGQSSNAWIPSGGAPMEDTPKKHRPPHVQRQIDADNALAHGIHTATYKYNKAFGPLSTPETDRQIDSDRKLAMQLDKESQGAMTVEESPQIRSPPIKKHHGEVSHMSDRQEVPLFPTLVDYHVKNPPQLTPPTVQGSPTVCGPPRAATQTSYGTVRAYAKSPLMPPGGKLNDVHVDENGFLTIGYDWMRTHKAVEVARLTSSICQLANEYGTIGNTLYDTAATKHGVPGVWVNDVVRMLVEEKMKRVGDQQPPYSNPVR